MEVSKINTTVARSFSFQFHLRSCNTWTATIYKTKYSALFSLIQMHSHLQNTFRVRVMWLSHRDQRKNVKKKKTSYKNIPRFPMCISCVFKVSLLGQQEAVAFIYMCLPPCMCICTKKHFRNITILIVVQVKLKFIFLLKSSQRSSDAFLFFPVCSKTLFTLFRIFIMRKGRKSSFTHTHTHTNGNPLNI